MSAPVILPNVTNTVNCFTLRNSQIVRPFSVTPAWKTLRVGVRMVMTTGSNPSTNDITGTPRFTLGFCSGSNLYGDLTCGHFAGVQTNGYMNYASNAGSYNSTTNYSGVVRTLKKVGAIETVFSADIEPNNTFFIHDRPTYTNKYGVIFFDLTRPQGTGNSGSLASGSYTGSYWRNVDWASANYFVNYEYEFLTQVASNSPTFINGNWGVITAGTFYINEVQDGYFDSVYVAWDREFPDPEIKIAQIAVAVVA